MKTRFAAKTSAIPSRRERRRAVATVEFALILPILLAITMGIIEFGYQVKTQLTVANAAREGVRFAALGNQSTDVKTRIKGAAGTLNPALTDGQIMLDQTSDKSSTSPSYTAWAADSGGKNGVPTGNLLRVTVTYPYNPLTGFFPFMRGRNIQVSATMTREAS